MVVWSLNTPSDAEMVTILPGPLKVLTKERLSISFSEERVKSSLSKFTISDSSISVSSTKNK